ncbi:hypothetical protein Nmel_011095, partial [Mimus melanotis]
MSHIFYIYIYINIIFDIIQYISRSFTGRQDEWLAPLPSSQPPQAAQGKDHNAIFRGRCCFHRSNAGESMAWSESVDTVLANKEGLAAFRTFLKSEFSEENVEFWLACEDFKKTKSSTKIALKAQKIYSDFIQADAPKEINIDFHTKSDISQHMSDVYKELVQKHQDRNHKRSKTAASYSCITKKRSQLSIQALTGLDSVPAGWVSDSVAEKQKSPDFTEFQ